MLKILYMPIKYDLRIYFIAAVVFYIISSTISSTDDKTDTNTERQIMWVAQYAFGFFQWSRSSLIDGALQQSNTGKKKIPLFPES